MNDVENLDTIEEQVEAILLEYPQARNSDRLLEWKMWQRFYGVGDNINFEQYQDMPSASAIERVRRKFNENGKYLPTSEKVAIQRHLNINEWKAALGYNVEDNGQMRLF
jgi:hypothetical protein